MVLSGMSQHIPKTIINAIDLTGTALVPIANFTLGAVLGTISLKMWPSFSDTIRVLSVKFILIPLVAVIFMLMLNLQDTNSLLSDVILIQAVSPPAIAILIQIKNYGGDAQRSGSMMLISYALCILVIPLWMALWKVI